jgi:tetratricopeptide (TPR) repeat protein
MKQIFTAFLISVLTVGFAVAQKKEVQSAWNYIKYDQLDKAQQAIDKAITHEQTMNDDKTWYYRGIIYQSMYNHEKFSKLSDNPLKVAAESFKKVVELDPNTEYADDINKRMRILGTEFFNRGATQYNQDNYQASIEAFSSGLKVNEDVGLAAGDSINLLSHLYSAYAAERMKNSSLAKEHYQKLMDLDYKDPKIYIFLANIHKNETDTTRALEVLQSGRQKFPDDSNLIIEELNIYLASGKNEESIDRLQLAIQKEPGNPTLHFALGTNYDKIGEENKAIAAYQKAIDLKPDYFDAYYNLGVMHFNEGAELANKANEIPPKQIKEYEEAKKIADAKFNQAKPFLEKASELNPEDRQTLITLRQIYARENNPAKVEEINKKLGH